MSTSWKDTQPKVSPESEEELASALTSWFSVAGDMDDFIFFGDTSREHSEK